MGGISFGYLNIMRNRGYELRLEKMFRGEWRLENTLLLVFSEKVKRIMEGSLIYSLSRTEWIYHYSYG